MRSIRSSVPLLLTVLSMGFAWNSEAHANPLRDASSEYKHAVKQFEIAIYRRGFDRPAKDLIQELEEAAIRMRSASFHPQRLDRLECAWREVQYLHPRVEVGIFGASTIGRRCPDIELEQCWERVNCAFADLAQAVAYVCGPLAPLAPRTGFPLESSYPPAFLPNAEPQYGIHSSEPGFWAAETARSRGPGSLAPQYSDWNRRSESLAWDPAREASAFPALPPTQQARTGAGAVSLERGDLRAMLMQTVLQRMAVELNR